MTKLLIALRDLLYLGKDIFLQIIKVQKKEEAKKVVKEVEDEKSQEPMEEYIAGESGHTTRYNYHFLRKRKSKKTKKT